MKKILFFLLLSLNLNAGLIGRYYTSIGWFDVGKTHVRWTKEGFPPGNWKPYKIYLKRGDTAIVLGKSNLPSDTLYYYKDCLYPGDRSHPYCKKIWNE